jgi:hypothetical protein
VQARTSRGRLPRRGWKLSGNSRCFASIGDRPKPVNRDFRDLLAEFNAHHVDFLVVGAHALAAHGHVRATKDLDIWVRPCTENAARVLAALRSFGAPLHDLTERDLAEPGVVFQMGVAPVRIDIVTSISGVEFDAAWPRRLCTRFADQPASVLGKDDLIRNKRAAGRTQDLADVEWLEGHGVDEK